MSVAILSLSVMKDARCKPDCNYIDGGSWKVENGKLTLSDMRNYNYGQPAWYHLKDCITSAEISEGVTFIGGHVFAGLNNIKSIVVPDSVTEIELYAFSNMSGFDLIIPSNIKLKSDGKYALYFGSLPENATIHCLGKIDDCQTALGDFFAQSDDCPEDICKCKGNKCRKNSIELATENQCNSIPKYYFDGSNCKNRPTDGNDISCDYEYSGYVKVGDYCVAPENSYAKKHYTPAEAAQWLNEDNNTITLTFKK